jgi:ketosteroid isomerase-like protein
MNRIGKLMVAAAAVTLTVPAWAADDPRVAAEIMALARAQWASEIAGQPFTQQMTSVADDYTEFNGDYPTRIDGKAMAMAMGAIPPSTKSVYGDMQNPKVQVYGDTAILTYNFAGISRQADGKMQPSIAKSTRVYNRQNGRWMMVHANFAPVPAPPGN